MCRPARFSSSNQKAVAQAPVEHCWQEIKGNVVDIILCDDTDCPGSPNYISKKLPWPEA